MQYPEPGFGLVGEYQVSGLPWLTQSSGVKNLYFPYVTQWVVLKSTTNSTVFAMTSNGMTGSNKVTVAAGSMVGPLYLRIKELYVSGGTSATWEVIAGLTMIQPHKMPTLSAAFAPGVVPPYSNSSGFGYSSGLG